MRSDIAPMIMSAFLLVSSVFAVSSDFDASSVTGDEEVLVKVDPSRITGVNNLTLGFMLDWEWKVWLDQPVLRQLARDAGFGLVRFYDFRPTRLELMPCVYWNETARNGMYNWTLVDLLVSSIFEIGAEPLVCLGNTGADVSSSLPHGMKVNPATELPNPESYASYAAEWVKHFKMLNLPVRYYEIMNEPWTYFGWEPVNLTRLANYMQLFNAVAENMRQIESGLVISFDFIIRKPVLDFWLANGGADVDSLNFHKYGDWIVGRKTDKQLFETAESEYFGKCPMGYSVEEARQVWFKARGKLLPAINSESNFNSAWKNGTEPRLQQMAGAVWTALVLRMGILSGLNYNVYYSLCSSLSWGQKNTQTGGAGFGCINSDNDQPWYPYYVSKMLGSNLGRADFLVDATSSSEDVETFAWIHDGKLNIFLICKADTFRRLYLKGIEGEFALNRIDSSIPLETIKHAQSNHMICLSEPLVMNGYTVAHLQSE